MNKEYIQQITRGFTEQPETRFIKDVINESEPWKKELTKVSESIHYHGRHVTELEANLISPEPKLVIEKESYDMIWKAGYIECLNHLEEFVNSSSIRTVHESLNKISLKSWADHQRKHLTPLVSGLEILKKL